MKRLVLSVFLFIAGCLLFGQEKITLSSISNFSFTPLKAVSSETVAFSQALEMSSPQLNANLAVQAGTSRFHTQLKLEYAPDFLRALNFSLKANYHTVTQPKTFTHHDFQIGPAWHTPSDKPFVLYASALYFAKITCISETGNFTHHSLTLDFALTYKNKLPLEYSVAARTVGYFDYTFYVMPFLNFSAAYIFPNNAKAGLEMQFKYIDGFTVPTNLNEMKISVFGRIPFKSW